MKRDSLARVWTLTSGQCAVMDCLLTAFDHDWFRTQANALRARTPNAVEQYEILFRSMLGSGILEPGVTREEEIDVLAAEVKQATERWLKANVIH